MLFKLNRGNTKDPDQFKLEEVRMKGPRERLSSLAKIALESQAVT